MALVKRTISHLYTPRDLLDNPSTVDGRFMLSLAKGVERTKPRIVERVGIYPFAFIGGFFRPHEREEMTKPEADKEVVDWMNGLTEAIGCSHTPFMEGKNIPVVGAYSVILMETFPDVIRDLYASIKNGENSRLVLRELEFYSLVYKRLNKSQNPNLKQDIITVSRYIWENPMMAQSYSTLTTVEEAVTESNFA